MPDGPFGTTGVYSAAPGSSAGSLVHCSIETTLFEGCEVRVQMGMLFRNTSGHAMADATLACRLDSPDAAPTAFSCCVGPGAGAGPDACFERRPVRRAIKAGPSFQCGVGDIPADSDIFVFISWLSTALPNADGLIQLVVPLPADEGDSAFRLPNESATVEFKKDLVLLTFEGLQQQDDGEHHYYGDGDDCCDIGGDDDGDDDDDDDDGDSYDGDDDDDDDGDSYDGDGDDFSFYMSEDDGAGPETPVFDFQPALDGANPYFKHKPGDVDVAKCAVVVVVGQEAYPDGGDGEGAREGEGEGEGGGEGEAEGKEDEEEFHFQLLAAPPARRLHPFVMAEHARPAVEPGDSDDDSEPASRTPFAPRHAVSLDHVRPELA